MIHATLATRHPIKTCTLDGDDPDADEVVGVTGKEGLAIGGPGEGLSLGLASLLGQLVEVGLEVVDDRLGLEVEDLDRRGGGSTEPVTVGGEDKGVDDVSGLKGVEVLAVVEVPEHDNAVLATGGSEGSVGGDGEGVDVTGVAEVVGLELALGELPNLMLAFGQKRYYGKEEIRDLGGKLVSLGKPSEVANI